MRKFIRLYILFLLFTYTVNAQLTEQNSNTNVNLNDVYIVNQNTSWAVGNDGKIYSTTNGGGSVTAVEKGDLIKAPENFELSQNYPNPFNPATTIKFSIPSVVDANFASTTAHVTLIVYNLLGQKVAKLVNGELSSGNHPVSFDASKLSSGIYIYRLRADAFTQTKKMLMLK